MEEKVMIFALVPSVSTARRQRHRKHGVDGVMLQCVTASDSVQLSHRAGQDCCGKSPNDSCRRAQDVTMASFLVGHTGGCPSL